MQFMKRFFYTIIAIIVFLYIVSSLASFFQIQMSVYGNYALFISVLILFYSILPNKVSNIF